MSANVRDDFVAQGGAILAPSAGAAEAFDAVGEVAEFDARAAGGEDAAQGEVEFVEEGEFVAGAGRFGEGGEGDADGGLGEFEAAGHFRVADDLEDAGEGAQTLAGDDVFLEFAFEVAGHALGDVGSEPPTIVAGSLGGLGYGTLKPDAFVTDGALVGEADEREVIGESDQGI